MEKIIDFAEATANAANDMIDAMRKNDELQRARYSKKENESEYRECLGEIVKQRGKIASAKLSYVESVLSELSLAYKLLQNCEEERSMGSIGMHISLMQFANSVFEDIYVQYSEMNENKTFLEGTTMNLVNAKYSGCESADMYFEDSFARLEVIFDNAYQATKDYSKNLAVFEREVNEYFEQTNLYAKYLEMKKLFRQEPQNFEEGLGDDPSEPNA